MKRWIPADAPDGTRLTLDEEQIIDLSRDTVHATIQTVAELTAIAATGIMPPDKAYMETTNAWRVQSGDQPYDDAYFTQQRLNTPLAIPDEARAVIHAGLHKVMDGDILLLTRTTNRASSHAGGTMCAYVDANTARKYDGSTPIPVVEMYLYDGKDTPETGDDTRISGRYGPGESSSDALILMHELGHGLDDIDGSPTVEPGEGDANPAGVKRWFLTEYKSYYLEGLTESFDRREKHRILENTLWKIEDFACNDAADYQTINDLYQTDPSFRMRVDLILGGLEAHKDITPDLAEQIINADSDAAAQAILDATPEAINTAPNNPVCD